MNIGKAGRSARIAATLLAAAAAWSYPGGASSQDYPTRTITLSVPYGAGSTTDIFSRVLAEQLSVELKQPVIVENKPGAGGTLGTGQVVRAPADGYTLVAVVTSSVAINRALYKNLTFDPATDLTAISIPSSSSNALIVASTPDINSVEDLIAKAKNENPARYNSPGNGTSQQLSALLFSRLAGFKAEHIPYRGQEGITGMMGGQTLFGFASIPSVAGLVEGGKLKILATTGSRPSAAYPNIPTLSSKGMKEFEYGELWYGVAVRSTTPAPIREKLEAAFAKVVADPKVRQKLDKLGFDPIPEMNTAQRAKFVSDQVRFWGELVKSAGEAAE